MEKKKRWEFILILAVVFLTVYNILPTVFFYSKPLKEEVGEKRAQHIALSIAERSNSLEKQSTEWLASFCKGLKVKPSNISLDPSNSQFVHVTFKNSEEAETFRRFLPKAGLLIPFVPAQLSLYSPTSDPASKVVTVQRRIPIHFDPAQINNVFQFSANKDSSGNPTSLYRALVTDRVLQIAVSLGGVSQNGQYVSSIVKHGSAQSQDLILTLCNNALSFAKTFGEDSEITKRFFTNFTQVEGSNRAQVATDFISAIESLKQQNSSEYLALERERDSLKAGGHFLDTVKKQRLELLTSRETTLNNAISLFKRHASALEAGVAPLDFAEVGSQLSTPVAGNKLVLSLKGHNPFFETLTVDWETDKIFLQPYRDLSAIKEGLDQELVKQGAKRYLKDQIDQILYNEIAYLARQSSEKILPVQDQFEISLSDLSNSKSFLAMRLATIAESESKKIRATIEKQWHPSHPDLKNESFPIWDYETYQSLPSAEQKLGLLIYAPATQRKMPAQGFRMNSIYVVAKGIDRIIERVKADPQSEQSNLFLKDFQKLKELLQTCGYFGYPGNAFAITPEFSSSFIFENEDYYQTVLKATRENFSVHGTKRYAVLEFSDVEQRILTENKIDNSIHEDLLKWRDDYFAAQANLRGVSPFEVAKPTQSTFLSNLKLSTIKYFRGDDRKIIKWGLDLSGGKTVQIELRDTNNKLVTSEEDLKEATNELYSRVNKMGVSEVSIRRENHLITLDFPGSQGLSAAELVKASSMYFHIVNEKFGLSNAVLKDASNQFLQDIWNEAVVTNRKGAEELNQIAWKHLHGDSMDPEMVEPRSQAARILYENGLRIATPWDSLSSSTFDDRTSKIALFRGNDFTQWEGNTHPLLIVFNNFALEGSNLDEVQAGYDPSKGNYLMFKIRGSYSEKGGFKRNPRDDLYAWTLPFSKEKVTGSPNEVFSKGKGWRMAVILNDTIVSAPTLESGLRDSGMISGSFTQREIYQLESDLKAGSLSFTPKILSEKNVSPELGSSERMKGITATALAIILVIAAMVGYYRFGGLVASIAVVFNLLIMWAALQNIGAALTLSGIAGIVLTLGMAVDANVLVFERFREEYSVTGRIASAIQAAYKKAFSAIIDSNLTTIIAALILLNFDSGPVKGFAVTLIIGIVSSMITALFMTRFFFTWWVKNPKNDKLTMCNFVKTTNFNFLKYTKATVIVSAIVILVGFGLCAAQRASLFGMDFTGGYSLNLQLQPKENVNYRALVENALVKAGATSQEFEIRELTPPNNLRLFLSKSLSLSGRPFFGLPLETDLKEVSYAYENNPKILWTVNALQNQGIQPTPDSLEKLEKNWAEVSGQMSETMRNQAVVGIILALACIFIYIVIRFEFKYAIAATLGILHDVIFAIASLAILHAIGVNIQIDLHTIAALMTIIGYSLNDTIIVFDRIREDVKLMRKSSLEEVISHALNATLSRTVLTSGTTLLVLLPLIFLGGSTVFGFALIMAIGVLFGTLSSLFVASPLMLYFHHREMKKKHVTYSHS